MSTMQLSTTLFEHGFYDLTALAMGYDKARSYEDALLRVVGFVYFDWCSDGRGGIVTFLRKSNDFMMNDIQFKYEFGIEGSSQPYANYAKP